MKYGCIGGHLSHSYSPQIHARLSSEPYELLELSREDLPTFFAERNFLGINVTIPYKEAVTPYLDELDESARAVGAVNTVVKRGGRLIGYNTDPDGLSALCHRMHISLRGKRVLILGTGGTSKTALAYAKREGAKEALLVSRTKGKGDLTYADLGNAAEAFEILIQTTPVGMYPNDEGCPIDLDRFLHLEALIDAVYHPLRTTLVLRAREKVIQASGGLYMLVAQAAKAASLFHKTEYSENEIEKIDREIRKEKENLVLVGMPGSGKSTVGRFVAARLGRRFYDLDEEVEKRTKKTIPELFSLGGEEAFRKAERSVTEALSKETGVVLATGGGTPLFAENLLALRRNGSLWLLDRPFGELVPTDDRPLAGSKEALDALYRERMPRYQALCDRSISVCGSLEETIKKLENEWRNA